jgi:hypothetical protein
MARQTTFQVRSLIAVDIATLSQTVNHANHFWQKFSCCCFVLQIAQVFDSRTRRFFVVAVLQTTLVCLTNTLEGRTMVCHNFIISKCKIPILNGMNDSSFKPLFNLGAQRYIEYLE